MLKYFCFVLFLSGAAPKTPKESENAPNEGDDVGADVHSGGDMSLVKLTKPERRAKLKKSKKEAKKQTKELAKPEEVQQTPQAEVLVFHICLSFLFKKMVLSA